MGWRPWEVLWFAGFLEQPFGILLDTIRSVVKSIVSLFNELVSGLFIIISFCCRHSRFGFLILGRVIAEFTAGGQPIAQATIVDLSSEEHKIRNIGLISLSIVLGFTIGLIIGGVLSDDHFIRCFGCSRLFTLYFAALISCKCIFIRVVVAV